MLVNITKAIKPTKLASTFVKSLDLMF